MLVTELRVTSYKLRAESLKALVEIQKYAFKSTSSFSRVTSLTLQVMTTNQRVTSSNPRVKSSNSWVTSSNPRVASSNSRSQESFNH